MARRSCDGAGLLGAFRAAVANLEAHVEEINGLNVYPVPDGDTGSNMTATVRAALEEAEAVSDQPAERIAQAVSFGALMGARGNSGVITSQILRGMSEGLAGKHHFNGLDLAHALTQGTKAAYGAVAKPVEGTILTVIREASDAAVAAAERDNDIESVLAATVDAAEKSVARTPSLLAILREAGVVDSGGQGLFRLFQGALAHVRGQAVATHGAVAEAARPSALVAHADEGFGYETMFLLQAPAVGRLDVDAIRAHLESIGESVLVAGDARAVKVHVHNERPDQVIAYGLGLGTLSRISVENLDNQARDVRETRAAAFTAAELGDAAEPHAAGDVEPASEGAHSSPPEPAPSAARPTASADGDRRNGTGPVPSAETLPLAVLAVAPGDGLAAVFREFGVAAVVRGGQSANPSTGELMEALSTVDAREVVILPNNPNVVMAARQVAAMADRPVLVVPTRNAAEGFAALLALDPTKDASANVVEMTEAGRSVQTLAVTDAVRDATIGGRKVKRGQTIVLDPDDGLVAANGDRTKAILAGVAALQPGYELVTIYYGDGATLEEAEALARRLGVEHDGIEVEVVHGGQPHYRFLLSAE
jgi:DAK2 domain fusion protein YloV